MTTYLHAHTVKALSAKKRPACPGSHSKGVDRVERNVGEVFSGLSLFDLYVVERGFGRRLCPYQNERDKRENAQEEMTANNTSKRESRGSGSKRLLFRSGAVALCGLKKQSMCVHDRQREPGSALVVF